MTKKSQDETEAVVEEQATVEAVEEEAVAGNNDDLAGKLEAALAESQENHDKMLRMAAELENFKKRTAREKETALRFAEENLLKELLPSLDNLERAVEQGRADDNGGALLEGVEMTIKGLQSSLEKFGLQTIESVGQVFDPNFHEAIGMEACEGAEANTVLKEFQKGYLYKERLLRAAKVIVVGA